MAYFKDLAPCTWFGENLKPPLLAVGWLEGEHDYSRGSVEPQFFVKLCELIRTRHVWTVTMGFHDCTLCRFAIGCGGVQFTVGRNIVEVDDVGSGEVVVPGKGCFYAAPTGILHYLDAHGYAPPSEFVDAVMTSPPMRSMEYLKLVAPIDAEFRRRWKEQADRPGA